MAFYTESNAMNKNAPRIVNNEQGVFFVSGSKTPYTGKYATYYPNGVKSAEYTYENGVLRKVFDWNIKGQKRMVKLFETDGLLKDHIIWYSNGRKAYQECHENRMKSGVIASWNDRGVKVSESHYTNGQLHGMSTTWYENGQKSHEARWINGALASPVTKWKRDGGKQPTSGTVIPRSAPLVYADRDSNSNSTSEPLVDEGAP